MTVEDFNRVPGFAPIVETLATQITSGRNWDVEAEFLFEEECPSDCQEVCCVEPTPPALDEQEAEEMFDELLNETNPTVEVAGYAYDPAQVLKEMDPTAYRQEFLNWVDCQERDGTYSFEWNK